MCIEIQVMICKSTCATLLCRLVAYHQCAVVLTDAWPNPSKRPQIKYFLPFSSTQRGLYSTFQREKPQRSHPYLFLSCSKIQSNVFHFPPHPSTKDQGILISHRWIPTLKQDKKLPNRILSARLVPLALIYEDPFPGWTWWQLFRAPWGWTRAAPRLMLEIKRRS